MVSRFGLSRIGRGKTSWEPGAHFEPSLRTETGLVFREDHSLRSCEGIGWQAKASAPQKRKPLRTNVGQTLSSVNPTVGPNFSHPLTVVALIGAGPRGARQEAVLPSRR